MFRPGQHTQDSSSSSGESEKVFFAAKDEPKRNVEWIRTYPDVPVYLLMWNARKEHMLQEQLHMRPPPQGKEIATLAGGCFWCLEAVYDELKGVEDVVSGYSGGKIPNPSYEMVCTGTTGHAEVVQLTFDPKIISFKEILEVFFTIHDPTTLNRQGPDVGTQYRSAVFYHTSEQRAIAEQVIVDLGAGHAWDAPIVTELKPFDEFYPAEAYHQEYFRRNPNQAYCRVVISPKVARFRKRFLDKLRETS